VPLLLLLLLLLLAPRGASADGRIPSYDHGNV